MKQTKCLLRGDFLKNATGTIHIHKLYIPVLIVINNMAKKLILDSDNTLWKEVLKYKIDMGFKNTNEAVLDLIKRGLKYDRN